MQQNLMDSYAKFGEANQNVQQSNISYYSGLIHLLLKNPSAAKMILIRLFSCIREIFGLN